MIFINIFLLLLIVLILFRKELIKYGLIPNSLIKRIRSLGIIKNVINGLFYRELKTRVTKNDSGIIGIFIEPILVMIVFLLIFTLIRGFNKSSLDPRLFLLSGILLYTLFTQIAIRSINAIKANQPLFIYRPVKPIDTVIARSLIETGLYSIVLLTLSFGIFYLAEEVILYNFPLMVVSFISLAFTSFGIGLIVMVLGHRFPPLAGFIPVLTRPLWFISGVFFSIKSVPERFQPLLSWNPILQAIELTRHSYSINYLIDKDTISLRYLVSFAFVSLTFGIWVYLKNEKLLIKR